jgi:hypothetical protein
MVSATNGPSFPDPFRHDRSFTSTFWHAILATALFRCWHILIFFGAWATAVSVISATTHNLGMASTLLTVFVRILLCLDDVDYLFCDVQSWYRSRFCYFVQNDVEFREIQRGAEVLVANRFCHADNLQVDLVPCPG